QADVPQQGKKALDIIPADAQRFRCVEDQQVDVGERMKLTAPIAPHSFQTDSLRPFELIPGVVQDTVDEQGALVYQGANVFPFAEARIELPVGCCQCVLKDGDDRFFSQGATKTALIKEEQRP